MAIFKHRQTNEARDVDLALEKVAGVYGYPISVGAIDFESILGLNNGIELCFRRLRDGKVVLEGSRWDLYLTEEESKNVLLEDEEAAYLAQREEQALSALSSMNITTGLTIKDVVQEDEATADAPALQGNQLFVMLLIASKQVHPREFCQKTGLPAMAVLSILQLFESRGLVELK